MVLSEGIDPGTVRLVAQRLNHYANPGPNQGIIRLFNFLYLLYLSLERKINYSYNTSNARGVLVTFMTEKLILTKSFNDGVKMV